MIETNPPITIILQKTIEYHYIIHKIPNIDRYCIEISTWDENEKIKDVSSLNMNTYSLKYFLKHHLLELQWKDIHFEISTKDLLVIEFKYEVEEEDDEDEFEKTLVQILELQKGIYA